MPRIIAIESDYKRRRLVAMLIREYVQAEVKVAESVSAAIPLMRQKTPELILAPALLSPADSAQLMAQVRKLDAPYVQLVTIPALDMLVDTPKDEPSRLRSLIGSFGRRTPAAPQYDRAMVGGQIADAFARAREARDEYQAQLLHRAELEELAKRNMFAADMERRPTEVMKGFADLKRADRNDVKRLMTTIGDSNDERRIARRRPLSDVPWLAGASLPFTSDISLVNISTTGVLVESGSKFIPGSKTELRLTGEGTSLVVPVRFIRSEIARIDGLGVKYHAAAAFDKEIDLAGPRREPAAPSTPPEALAQLLASTLATPDPAEPAHVRFARGVRDLVKAREVQVRTATVSAPSAGRETLFFDVPGDDRARTTLQVVFDRGHNVTSSEFRLLKAAAWLTAAALELDQPAETRVKLLTERVA